MFDFTIHKTPESLSLEIVDTLGKLQWCKFNNNSLFSVTHSINHEESTNETSSFYELDVLLTDFFRDLDSQEGAFNYNEHGIEVDESPLMQDKIYREWGNKQDKIFWAGEGLLLIHNVFACAEGEYPMIITKPNIYSELGQLITNLLRWNSYNGDYTSLLAPAVYLGIEKI